MNINELNILSLMASRKSFVFSVKYNMFMTLLYFKFVAFGHMYLPDQEYYLNMLQCKINVFTEESWLRR